MRYVKSIALVVCALSVFSALGFLVWRDKVRDEKLDLVLVQLNQLKSAPVATSGTVPDDTELINRIKSEIRSEMGLLPLSLIRERRNSFVEIYSYDNLGNSSYGTAGYLGNGYFLTVKHAVVAIGSQDPVNPRKIKSVKLLYKGELLTAHLVDSGVAETEVDPGDWAIVRVSKQIDLPILNVNPAFTFEFAEPIFRLGNDYSKGIVVATGYVGQKMSNKLVTCLTDAHPGVSGGGVLNRNGDLVGIPVGRMQADFSFSFILPLREEMFRKVPHLSGK